MSVLIRAYGEAQEWVIIELQGELVVTNGALNGSEIGSLHYASGKEDVPLLTIGRHTLHGQRVPLSKPMALMRKAAQPASEAESKPLAAYDVVAVVRHKLLFDTRPVTKMLA